MSPADLRRGTAFIIDTNLWVEAARDRRARDALRKFQSGRRGRVFMLAVVAQELTAGAQTPEWRRDLAATLEPFVAEQRVLTVSYAAECDSGRVLAALAERHRVDLGTLTASFLNDVRIAAACREHGAVLITRNVGDFVAVQRHLAGFRFLRPWP